MNIAYRVVDTLDPEERLEDACLWKALHDEYGGEISALKSDADFPKDTFVFGRGRNYKGERRQTLRYWEDPAFIHTCGRAFTVTDFDHLSAEIKTLSAQGKGAFVKSIRTKEFAEAIPLGADWHDVIGDMAYSFIDAGPVLMVQELIEMKYEHRWFVIDREIVTDSPVAVHLTPLDHGWIYGWEFATPFCGRRSERPDERRLMADLAEYVAAEMKTPHAVIDTAMGADGALVIEFNPMALGNIGLFACDVRALATASRKLI